jgi:xylose isomerase
MQVITGMVLPPQPVMLMAARKRSIERLQATKNLSMDPAWRPGAASAVQPNVRANSAAAVMALATATSSQLGAAPEGARESR